MNVTRELDLPSTIAEAVDELAAGSGHSMDGIVLQALILYLNYLSAPDDTLADLMQIRARPEPLKSIRVLRNLLDRHGRGPRSWADVGRSRMKGRWS